MRALKVNGPSKQNQAAVVNTGSFHPSEAGQRAYAEAMAKELEGVF